MFGLDRICTTGAWAKNGGAMMAEPLAHAEAWRQQRVRPNSAAQQTAPRSAAVEAAGADRIPRGRGPFVSPAGMLPARDQRMLDQPYLPTASAMLRTRWNGHR